MTILYHEKQQSALCGQHCLNNLLQGPYYNAGTLADLALELDRREMALMMTEGNTAESRAFQQEGSGNVDEQGNFSIQVLSEAIKRSFALTLEDVRHEDVRPMMRDPASTAEGFVINRHAHWLCLRKIDGQWWRINSTEDAPERISDQALSLNLAHLKVPLTCPLLPLTCPVLPLTCPALPLIYPLPAPHCPLLPLTARATTGRCSSCRAASCRSRQGPAPRGQRQKPRPFPDPAVSTPFSSLSYRSPAVSTPFSSLPCRSSFLTKATIRPNQVPQHEGDPANWTDTTKALKFGTVLGGGGGGGQPEAKQVVAFSGSGQTLGGGGGGGAAGATGPDAQLAKALAQSKDEARSPPRRTRPAA